jgi:hypothetical protein
LTRSLNSAFQTQLRSADPKPVVLLRIATGLTAAASQYIRIANFESDVVFPSTAGSTFTARPFEISEVSTDWSEPAEIEIRIADADLAFDVWLDSTDFRLQTITRYLVERDSLDSSAKAITDTFRILSHTRADREITFTAEPMLGILSRLNLPRRILTREEAPNIPDRGIVE